MTQETEKRIMRNYEVSEELYIWLQETAKAERRPLIKQIEVILESVRNAALASKAE